jgi:hypothetical protein
MMSTQDINNINAGYPVANKFNDTQGFRDNFSLIKKSLSDLDEQTVKLDGEQVITGIKTFAELVVPTFNDENERNDYYNGQSITPRPGSIIFVLIGPNSSPQFQGWTGTAWVDLSYSLPPVGGGF